MKQLFFSAILNRLNRFLFLIILSVCMNPVYGKEIVLTNESFEIQLNPLAESLIDASGKLTINDVSRARFQESLPVYNDFINSAIWARLNLKNESDREVFYLEIKYPLLDFIHLYVCEKNGEKCILQKSSGDHEKFISGRDLEYRNFIFKTPIRKNEAKEIYLRIQSSGPLIVPITLWKPEAIFEVVNTQNYFYGAYYGIVLALIVYNLLIYFSIREKVYLYYIFHILFIALFSGSADGVNYEFLWREYPFISDNSPIIFMPLMIGSLILFTNRFLFLEASHKKTHISLIGLFLFSMALFVSSIFVPYNIMVRIQAAYSILVCIYLIYISVFLYIKDNLKPAKYYILALIVLLVTIILNRARLFGYLQHNLFTFQGIKIGSILEMLFLSLTLGDFVNVLKKEKMEVQKKGETDLLEAKAEAEKKVLLVKKEIESFTKKEIERMMADWHDNLGGDLVDIIYKLNKFIHSESVNPSDLIGLKKTAEEAVFQLKSRMISGSEMDMIREDLLDGLKLYLIDRYFHAGRAAHVEIDAGLYAVINDVISDFKKETLFLICKEISTNDLKYGTGISDWNLFLKDNTFILEMSSDSSYDAGTAKGTGMKSLHERASSLGGSVNFNLNENRFHFTLKILLH